MRARTVIATLVLAAATLTSFALPVGAQTTRTLDVTPDTGLASGDAVTVHGAGFTPGASGGVCQAVVNGSPGTEDCGSPISVIFVDSNGEFSISFTVARFIQVGGQQIDCAAPGAACVIASAEAADIAGTVVITPISFTPATGTPRPDLVFKRRDTQQLFEDNEYFQF